MFAKVCSTPSTPHPEAELGTTAEAEPELDGL